MRAQIATKRDLPDAADLASKCFGDFQGAQRLYASSGGRDKIVLRQLREGELEMYALFYEAHACSALEAKDYAQAVRYFRRAMTSGGADELARRTYGLMRALIVSESATRLAAQDAEDEGSARADHELAKAALAQENLFSRACECIFLLPEELLGYTLLAQACNRAGRMAEAVVAASEGLGALEASGLCYRVETHETLRHDMDAYYAKLRAEVAARMADRDPFLVASELAPSFFGAADAEPPPLFWAAGVAEAGARLEGLRLHADEDVARWVDEAAALPLPPPPAPAPAPAPAPLPAPLPPPLPPPPPPLGEQEGEI